MKRLLGELVVVEVVRGGEGDCWQQEKSSVVVGSLGNIRTWQSRTFVGWLDTSNSPRLKAISRLFSFYLNEAILIGSLKFSSSQGPGSSHFL